MGLERYREKRDFRATPEPRGRVVRRKSTDLSFVIKKHAASHLHYDFRLELDGVLLSWAVPKGPSLDPHDKRLAMHVEDHPLEYGDFEGIIPPNQYGSGTVMLWDRGTWIPSGDPREGYAKGRLKFQLEGEKLHGGWSLVRTHSSKYAGKADKAWLLIKENDDFAQSEPIVEQAPDSVLSGRSLEEIARDRENEWHSNRSVKENVRAGAIRGGGKTRAKRVDLSAALKEVAGAKARPMPDILTPTLATLVSATPDGDKWLHEIKYDGYRMVCRVDNRRAQIFSRNGKEWTEALQPIAAAAARIKAKQAWIDGELAVTDAGGHTSFQALQNALADPATNPLVFFVFDLLYLDGHDLRGVELIERKRLLRDLIGDNDPAIRYSADVQGSGEEFFKEACKLGLEGTISKRAHSVYRDGYRTGDWLKVKCVQRQEMVIGGFTDAQGSRSGFGALLLGVHEDNGLRYSGKVGTGFNDKTLAEIRPMLDKLTQPKPPFVNPPRGYEAKGVHWVKPQLVCEIAFTEWSNDGALRHPSFQGLRLDKSAADVVRERPETQRVQNSATTVAPAHRSETQKAAASAKPTRRSGTEKAAASPTPTRRSGSRTASASTPSTRLSAPRKTSASDTSGDVVGGVKLSNPDKQLFPETGLRKRDIAQYYLDVADWIVPHLRARPLSLVRCPDGWSRQCFYQKHADKSVHESVARVEVPESNGTAMYFSAASVTALIGLVQWGVTELHPWGARVPRLDRPDRLIFDFDPADNVEWQQIVEAVGLLRTLLDDLGLEGFLKTTGGKGLHVVVPIRATLDWEEAKGFTGAVAELLARTFPDRFTATVSKSQRTGRIYVDYLRNAIGATAIAPYAIRARANAPVSTPIAWDELGKDVRFDFFNVRNIPGRLKRLKSDPWAQMAKTSQSVTNAMFKRVGYASRS